MGAKYNSQKPDGYMHVRNEINRDRCQKDEMRAYEAASACRNLPPQTKENYGKKTYYKS